MKLLNGDCLEKLKELEPKSVDLVFCDLPYGQTSCEWDNKINLTDLWKELKRISKPTTPFFFTCSTKFGYELIKSNEKWFKYDLVWEKSAPCGFLCAKKMPMRKHEMIYVFYNKSPLYDISSHKHKFPNDGDNNRPTNSMYGGIMKTTSKNRNEPQYDPPLPTSVIHYESVDDIYGFDNRFDFKGRNGQPRYDPPLPSSVLPFKSERGKHKTQKPITMMNWILKYYSKENDVVLDPTMGSGSMGVACKEMNRDFIGIELDEEIYKSACERLTME